MGEKSQYFSNLCQNCNIKPKIAFIGGGNMAQALISGFFSSGIVSHNDVTVSDPQEATRNKLTTMNIKTTTSTPQLIDSNEGGIIILAIKPNSVSEFIQSCILEKKDSGHQPGLFISVCAGTTLQYIEIYLSQRWTKLPVIRVMPNTPALVGYGASAFSSGKFATRDHAEIVRCLLETVGTCDQVPETCMDAVTGLSASGPAFIYTVIDALSDGGVKVGLPRDISTKLAVQTVLGSAQMMLQTGKHPGELKNMVCSPGGTTIAGVHVLEEAKVRSAFMSAVEAATKRASELGQHK